MLQTSYDALTRVHRIDLCPLCFHNILSLLSLVLRLTQRIGFLHLAKELPNAWCGSLYKLPLAHPCQGSLQGAAALRIHMTTLRQAWSTLSTHQWRLLVGASATRQHQSQATQRPAKNPAWHNTKFAPNSTLMERKTCVERCHESGVGNCWHRITKNVMC